MYFIRRILVFTVALLLAGGIAQGEEKKLKYIGTVQCKVCHNKKSTGAQFAVWKEMGHAHAFDVLKGDEAKRVAAERGLPKPAYETPDCVKCHVTGYDIKTMKTPTAIKPAEGVQCETCHGPGSAHKADGRDVMTKKKTEDEIDWMANLKKVEEAICLKCHNDESPHWDPEKFTLKDGKKTGFDFEQAKKLIAHPNPKKAAAK